MVDIGTLGRMNCYLAENLKRYLQEHPGEFVLITQDEKGKLTETFYETKRRLDQATEKYRNLIGPTILTQRILPNKDKKKELEVLLATAQK